MYDEDLDFVMLSSSEGEFGGSTVKETSIKEITFDAPDFKEESDEFELLFLNRDE